MLFVSCQGPERVELHEPRAPGVALRPVAGGRHNYPLARTGRQLVLRDYCRSKLFDV